eukprot:scaffold3323_cov279-Pinguiococcus_pyrenoidosus.AAC.21
MNSEHGVIGQIKASLGDGISKRASDDSLLRTEVLSGPMKRSGSRPAVVYSAVANAPTPQDSDSQQASGATASARGNWGNCMKGRTPLLDFTTQTLTIVQAGLCFGATDALGSWVRFHGGTFFQQLPRTRDLWNFVDHPQLPPTAPIAHAGAAERICRVLTAQRDGSD